MSGSQARRIFGAPAIALVAMLATVASAQAGQRYAAPSGVGDPNLCLASAPCSIGDATNSFYTVDGDEVILSPGDYSVSSTLGTIDAVDIHGTGVPGLTRINSTSAIAGVQLSNAGAVLRNVTVNHSVGNESAVRGINGTMQNVVAISTSAHGCTWRDGTIRDSICLTKSNNSTALFVNEGGPGSSNLKLRNVTAIGTGTGSHGLRIYAGSGLAAAIDAKGTIASGVDKDVSATATVGSSANIVLDHSNFTTTDLGSGTTSISSPATNGNQTSAPVFVNAAADDYHQLPSSPTVDAGAVDGFSGTTDLDGDGRALGAASDIGADEYVPPASPLVPVAPTPDTVAPQTSITKKPKRTTTKRRARFTFSSSEADSTFRCKLDRGAYKPCGKTFTKRVKPGKHVLRVKAVDAAGNMDPTAAIFRWLVVKG